MIDIIQIMSILLKFKFNINTSKILMSILVSKKVQILKMRFKEMNYIIIN
jgi:hypothetical protein